MELKNCMENVIEAANANRNAQPAPEDYLKDGLLYCGKCHTQKQVRITLFGQTRTPRCLCRCAQERLEQEEARQRAYERAQWIKELRARAFPTPRMAEWTFARDDGLNERVIRIAKRYTEKFDELRKREGLNGMLLYGGTGTGKTYAAACVVNALTDRGYPCLMTNLSRLCNRVGASFEKRQAAIDELNDYELLVLDDLSAERESDYMNELVFHVIDARCACGKPMIVTTNLTGEQLKSPDTDHRRRICSRLLASCAPIEVAGADRRRQKLKDGYESMAELLGIK